MKSAHTSCRRQTGVQRPEHVPGPGLGGPWQGPGAPCGPPPACPRLSEARAEPPRSPPAPGDYLPASRSPCTGEKRNPPPPAPNPSGRRSGLTRVEGGAGSRSELGKSARPTAEAGPRPGREAPALTPTAAPPAARRGGAGGERGAAVPLHPTPRTGKERGLARPRVSPAARPREAPPACSWGRAGPRASNPAGRRARPEPALGRAHADVPAPAPLARGEPGVAWLRAESRPRGSRSLERAAAGAFVPVPRPRSRDAQGKSERRVYIGKGGCMIAAHPGPPEPGG